MPTKIKEANGTVFTMKYQGVFDYNGLVTFLIKWLQVRGYYINEKKHKHKMSCPRGFEIERDVEGWKNIDDFYRYKITFKMKLWDAYEVDAVKDGKKVKLWNARIRLNIVFEVVLDYDGNWEGSPWKIKMRDFYIQYIIKKDIIVKHADPLYYKLLGLNTKIKQFLDMSTATEF